MIEQRDTSRYHYLDLMRGLAIFFMIMQHAMIIHEVSEGEGDTLIGNIFILLGTAPAAPVFLFILGVFVANSKKSSPENIVRGIRLFVFGYIFNVLRFTIPALIGGAPYSNGNAPLDLLLIVDIFQVAGLSLIFLGVIKKIVKPRILFLVMIPAVLLVSPKLWGIGNNSPLLSPFTGVGGNVTFPLFPWIIFPLLGMYLNPYLLQRQLPWKALLLTGALAGLAGFFTLDLFSESDYSRLDFGTGLILISFVLFWTAISGFTVRYLLKSRFSIVAKTLFYWSRNVTPIFIIQWMIYGWSSLLIGVNKQNDVVSVLIGFSVLIVTHLLIKHTQVKNVIPIL